MMVLITGTEEEIVMKIMSWMQKKSNRHTEKIVMDSCVIYGILTLRCKRAMDCGSNAIIERVEMKSWIRLD